MFKFTFNAGGGLFNPFTAQAEERERAQQAVAPQTIARKLPVPPRRHPIPPDSISESAPISRKRGWTPSSSAPSAPISQPTQTNGWLDTPSRYLDAASHSHQTSADTDFDEEQRPAKRRRTLTDSIITTALSAALIGTTVGMTAYRMWRDRGKTSDQIPHGSIDQPPPPYEEEEWLDEMPKTKPTVRSPRSHRKPRPISRKTHRSRMPPVALSSSVGVSFHNPSPASSIPTQTNMERDERGDLDDQMDWMGDKIRHLIEEGQKALGKEVVVMSDNPDANEDGAVDDGLEGWEEVEDDRMRPGPSSPTSSTFRSKGARQANPISGARSVSPPTSFGKGSFSDKAISPWPKRPRSHSRTPRLGRPQDNSEDVKVLYESSLPNQHQLNSLLNIPDDDDSRSLSERLEKIRRAYQIH